MKTPFDLIADAFPEPPAHSDESLLGKVADAERRCRLAEATTQRTLDINAHLRTRVDNASEDNARLITDLDIAHRHNRALVQARRDANPRANWVEVAWVCLVPFALYGAAHLMGAVR